MANSAWSGNTAGLASATSPGIVGITTQTFAGDKTLTGLTTASGGILNTGLTGANATLASTPGGGKVGEYKQTGTGLSNQSSATNITGSNFITCGSGIWIVKSLVSVGNVAPVQFQLGVSFTLNGVPVASSSGMSTGVQFLDTGNTTQSHTASSSDNYFVFTASQNLYPTVYISAPFASTYSVTISIQAYRIA